MGGLPPQKQRHVGRQRQMCRRDGRERFQSGELARSWAERFPQLFGEADLRIALNQPRYHFYEWLTAVRLFSDHGYLIVPKIASHG